MDNRKFTEQELIRRQKHQHLIKNNKDPFQISHFRRTNTISELHHQFSHLSKEELSALTATPIAIAGRIKLFREAGKKVAFIDIQDHDNQIQLYARAAEFEAGNFEDLRNYDLGDIIGAEGVIMRTNHGELSLRVNKTVLLSKALRPLPDKHAGIQDIEERYRRRYVDLIVNPETKNVFRKRTKIIRAIQNYLDRKGYLEVETPILQTIKAGAAAKPFISHYNALNHDFYLRIATELPLKRLIVGGFEGVYEIGRIFRNEGMDSRHNPEFTSLELYVAYEDMNFLMDLTEKIIRIANKAVNTSMKINYGSAKIDLAKPFKRIHMVDAIKKETGIDFWKEMSFAEAKKLATQRHLVLPKHFNSVGHIINLFFENFVEEKIKEPTFIYGHPIEISPLAKTNRQDKRFTDRFELFILGREYANAFSELNDPIEQHRRFMWQVAEAKTGNVEAEQLDLDFIEALETGMPPTAGLGLGIDRLVMLLTNSDSIKDVLLFPQMKPRAQNKK